MRVLWAHLQEEPPDPRRPPQRPVARVRAHAAGALQKDPDERPASAGEYARMLAAAAGA